MRGRFISFEGCEGSGKSTHISLLAERLSKRGIEVVRTREPGGTPLCENIRGLLQYDTAGESPVPRAETLLFCASRAQLVQKIINPALERGAWVLSDRFLDSTIAYQGYGRGFDIGSLDALIRFATDSLVPDLTLLLASTYDDEKSRLAERYRNGAGPDRFESEKAGFHSRVKAGFDEMARKDPARIRKIRTDIPVEEAHEAIYRTVCGLFPEIAGDCTP